MAFFFYVAELIGTAAFALSGALVAIHKRLDLFGVLLLSVITALGIGVSSKSCVFLLSSVMFLFFLLEKA